MARVTGLEPATSGVTGRHSNQLSYTRAFFTRKQRWPPFRERLITAFAQRCQALNAKEKRQFPNLPSGAALKPLRADGAIAIRCGQCRFACAIFLAERVRTP